MISTLRPSPKRFGALQIMVKKLNIVDILLITKNARLLPELSTQLRARADRGAFQIKKRNV